MSTPPSSSPRHAFVTLVTSDHYVPGALVVAAALRDLHHIRDFEIVCLITPESLDVASIKALRHAFDAVVGVELIEQRDNKGLKLLGRLDLNTVLTKIHVFRLTQYDKIVFLDADVLPIRPLAHLFSTPHEFSAVPDVGWPDVFNSGFLVLTPGEDKFARLNDLLKSQGSWDGGDQGLLNEWRGADWNRLSFIYNTTPTAAYTYAPAYERFGAQIACIHFIGPDKPWNALPVRPPRSARTGESQPAYDYASLLDRWFAVYDRHYRVSMQAPFGYLKYTSVWDKSPAEAAARRESGSALSLEDLRRIAVGGSHALGISELPPPTAVQAQQHMGEYRSMPLEGRIDLMRPPLEPEAAPTMPPTVLVPVTVTLSPPPQQNVAPPQRHQDSQLSFGHIPHSPDYPHGPSSDHPRTDLPTTLSPGSSDSHSQPPRSVQSDVSGSSQTVAFHPEPFVKRRAESPGQQNEHQFEAQRSAQGAPVAPSQPPSGSPRTTAEPLSSVLAHSDPSAEYSTAPAAPPVAPQRPSSPPLLLWNPAVEPPPHNVPTPNAFPPDTYFPNAWDRSQQAHVRGSSAANDFFQPLPPPQIPQSLVQQGHYRRVTGEDEQGHVASPNPNKVHTVFPWEDRPHRSDRIFPPDESTYFPQEVPAVSQKENAPAASPPANVFASPKGLPPQLSFVNAWDTVPGIQKYASKLVRPPPRPRMTESVSESELPEGRRRASWKANSVDGDDEDEGADDTSVGDVQWDSDGESRTSSRRSLAPSSVSSGDLIRGPRKEYRSRGVQTVRIPTRTVGVQASFVSSRSKQAPASARKPWPMRGQATPKTQLKLLPPVDVAVGPSASLSSTLTPGPVTPRAGPPLRRGSPLASPREMGISAPLPPTRSPAISTQPRSGPADRPRPQIIPDTSSIATHETHVAPVVPALVSRQLSNDLESLASPISSAGPLSPPEGEPLQFPPVQFRSGTPPNVPIALPPVRKSSGRIWDDARGLESLKSRNEEVLRRFLTMTSWQDEAGMEAD